MAYQFVLVPGAARYCLTANEVEAVPTYLPHEPEVVPPCRTADGMRVVQTCNALDEHLRKCPQLTRMRLIDASADVYKVLRRCRLLVSLTVEGVHWNALCLALPSLHRLQVLRIYSRDIFPSAAAQISTQLALAVPGTSLRRLAFDVDAAILLTASAGVLLTALTSLPNFEILWLPDSATEAIELIQEQCPSVLAVYGQHITGAIETSANWHWSNRSGLIGLSPPSPVPLQCIQPVAVELRSHLLELFAEQLPQCTRLDKLSIHDNGDGWRRFGAVLRQLRTVRFLTITGSPSLCQACLDSLTALSDMPSLVFLHLDLDVVSASCFTTLLPTIRKCSSLWGFVMNAVNTREEAFPTQLLDLVIRKPLLVDLGRSFFSLSNAQVFHNILGQRCQTPWTPQVHKYETVAARERVRVLHLLWRRAVHNGKLMGVLSEDVLQFAIGPLVVWDEHPLEHLALSAPDDSLCAPEPESE
eukprot:NODE_411_length_1534_cov_94.347548_g379_i0.p1 GENE.NODE_411_length_1534_cov_94.347548_g379_i0~~NODE_411_length_1534_cov_94.347548_g379_i0.p1  ORF type:complete len:472 (+),score=39.72 NODE_411_length_1534_cov_94.347548_g379_i0:66-1481(+)